MTTAGSTATLPEVRIPPPADGIDRETVVDDIAAPRHDGKNLLIKIDVGFDKAIVHSQTPEHVGTHKERHVLFCADKHCWLIFSKSEVFNAEYLELQPGVRTPAQVSNDPQERKTDYVVRVEAPKTTNVAKMAKTAPMHGPVIVVP